MNIREEIIRAGVPLCRQKGITVELPSNDEFIETPITEFIQYGLDDYSESEMLWELDYHEKGFEILLNHIKNGHIDHVMITLGGTAFLAISEKRKEVINQMKRIMKEASIHRKRTWSREQEYYQEDDEEEDEK